MRDELYKDPFFTLEDIVEKRDLETDYPSEETYDSSYMYDWSLPPRRLFYAKRK